VFRAPVNSLSGVDDMYHPRGNVSVDGPSHRMRLNLCQKWLTGIDWLPRWPRPSLSLDVSVVVMQRQDELHNPIGCCLARERVEDWRYSSGDEPLCMMLKLLLYSVTWCIARQRIVSALSHSLADQRCEARVDSCQQTSADRIAPPL
jgi:hypothetical protein